MGEPSIRRNDELQELRERYNRLCVTLTHSAGTASPATDRLMQELQSLALQIASQQARSEMTTRPAPTDAPSTSGARPGRPATMPRTGNVVAFRCRLRGTAPENPRLPAALNALTRSLPMHAPAGQGAAAETASESAGTASSPTSIQGHPPLAAAVAQQGSTIERIAHGFADQRRLIERIERRMSESGVQQELTTEIGAVRLATERQGQQLVALATAVHRLAKLLAAGGGSGSA